MKKDILATLGYVWKSNDNSVATINSNGKITAKSSGKCIITATWGKKKATCKVRVYDNEELYEQMLDASMADDIIYLALKTNDYDLIYDSNIIEENVKTEIKAAKKVKEILDQVDKEGMTDFQKIMEIANWMEHNIQVDNTFESKFAKKLKSYDNEKYYIDGLLYGKVSEEGFGMLFQLLVYSCGIRCEWIKEDSEFNTDKNGIEYVQGSNVVQLEGAWYYFDIGALGDNVDTNDQIVDKCMYDRIVYSNSNIIHVTTNKFYEDSISKALDERSSSYCILSLNYHYFNTLGYNLDRSPKYGSYYYDFYTQSIRFATLKESLAKNNEEIWAEPKFVSYASYPDSTCDKYKKIMDDEINIINEVLTFADEVDSTYMSKEISYRINNNIFQVLDQKMIELEAKYESIKNTLVDRNAVDYLNGKMAEIKDKLSKMR